MNRVRWTRCFEPGCIQIREERGEGRPNKAKKKKRNESLESKKSEKISPRVASVAKQTVRLLEKPRLTSSERGQEKGKASVECRAKLHGMR